MNDSKKLWETKALVDNEEYESAINILDSDDWDLSPKEDRFRLVLIAHSLLHLGKYENAIEFADVVLQKKDTSEFASQIRYLSLVKLKKYDEAFEEIFHFLSFNEANLYKVTLEELLTDIQAGYINDEDNIKKIQNLAQRNNVNFIIDDGLN